MSKMVWLVTSKVTRTDLCVLRIYLLIVAILMYGDIQTTLSSDVKTDKTFYYSVSVHDAVDYRSVTVLENTVSPQTVLVTCNFTGQALASCQHRDIVVHMQHGGYSLLDTDKKTYPANFSLHRTSVATLTMSSNQSHKVINISNPLPGNWFIAAYLSHIDDTPLDCVYTLQLNVTSLVTTSVQQLQANGVTDVTLQQGDNMFKVFPGSTTWKLTIAVRDCVVGGSHPSRCPVVMSVRSGALPSTNSESLTVNCSHTETDTKCLLYAVNLLVQQWFYVKLQNIGNDTLTARLEVNTEECGHINHNDTILTSRTVSATHNPDCPPVYHLQRTENPSLRFTTQYGFGPTQEDMLMTLMSGVVTLLQFSVVPMKDTGGTLTLQTSLQLFSEPLGQKVLLHICLLRGVIPILNGDLHCGSQYFLELSSWANRSQVRHLPYPEPGVWFLALQGWCLPLNESSISKAEPCKQTAISFTLKTSPCVNSSCANTGLCYLARRGPYLLSTCKCQAGWRGYGCTDGSAVKSKAWQLAYTFLLTLTNLAFIPAIILSIHRRYLIEALVYTANMVFSGLYHACDVTSWSVYHTCVLPYHVLSYCDFFSSILSFVVTLTAMAELPPTATSLVQIINIFFLVLAIEWRQHSLVTFLVPSVFCLVIVIVTRGLRLWQKLQCGVREWCLLAVGVLLASVGMCLFAFVETHENYPIVHSMWHICMALSIIFLLPNNKHPTKEEGVSEFALSESPMSSDDADLLPADYLAGRSSDTKNDIIL